METYSEYMNESLITEGIFGAAMDIFTFKGKIQKLAVQANKDLEAVGIKKISKINNENEKLEILKTVLNRYEMLIQDTAGIIDSMRISDDMKVSFKKSFKNSIINGLEEKLLNSGLSKQLEDEIRKFASTLRSAKI